MSVHNIRKEKKTILALCRQYGVTRIRIFGSVARGEEDTNSDVDFLVELEPGRSLFDLGGLQMALQELLGCKVDVVTQPGIRQRLKERILAEVVDL